ncbi:hypothetical protein JCM17960_14610 [Magnetospira thiophila]
MGLVSAAALFRLLILILVLAGVGAGMVLLVTDDRPAIAQAATPGADDARRLKGLVKSVKRALAQSDRDHVSLLTEQQITGLLALAARGVSTPWIVRAQIESSRLHLRLTTALPRQRYLNMDLSILSSRQGLRFGVLKVGKFSLPGRLFSPLLRLLLDHQLENGAGKVLLDAVRSVAVDESKVRVVYRFFKGDVGLLKKGLERAVARRQPLGDPALVRYYYERLTRVGTLQAWNRANQMGDYLLPLFSLASQRTAEGGDPIAENRAALLALTLYCGPPLFEKAIGDVRQGRLRHHYSRCRFTHLGGRHDLALHFAFSAYLRLVSDVAPAFVVGEVKELLDSSHGGSGFSFDDLAADRAGIKIADFALQSEASARRIQEVLGSDAADGQYFPEISDLPSSLAEAEFQQAFGTIEDPRYQDMLRFIDSRIAALPLYQ